jgi:hypothetical protein
VGNVGNRVGVSTCRRDPKRDRSITEVLFEWLGLALAFGTEHELPKSPGAGLAGVR